MKFKNFVSDHMKYWSIPVIAFGILEVLNWGVLIKFLPEQVCFWISVGLIFLFGICLYLLVSSFYEKVAQLFQTKDKELNQTIEHLKCHIDELDAANRELTHKLAESISSDLKSGNESVITCLQENMSENRDALISQMSDNDSALKEIILDKFNGLSAKSEAIVATQGLNLEALLRNSEAIVCKCEEQINAKTNYIVEQNSRHITDFSENVKVQNQENVERIISEYIETTNKTRDFVEEKYTAEAEKLEKYYEGTIQTFVNAENKLLDKMEESSNSAKLVADHIEEQFRVAEQAGSDRCAVIGQKLDDTKTELMRGLNTLQNDLGQTTTKTDRVIDLNNEILKKQQLQLEENQKVYRDIESGVERHMDNLSMIVREVSQEGLSALKDAKVDMIEQLTANELSRSLAEQAQRQSAIENMKDYVISSQEHIIKTLSEEMEVVNNCYLELKQDLEKNSEKIEQQVLALHKDTSIMMNALHDDVEGNTEKQERHLDLLDNQITELIKHNKNQIPNLLRALEENKKQVDMVYNTLQACSNRQLESTEESEQRTYDHILDLAEYLSNHFEKFENIQAELLNISQMVHLLKASYSALQDNVMENKGKSAKREEIKPDRVEEYKDAESGATVKNQYKQNKLVYSEMIVGGRKTYDVQYDRDGKILTSRNYNKQGEVVTEMEFYKNGEVKSRKEVLIKNGKKETIISKFNEKGQKIK